MRCSVWLFIVVMFSAALPTEAQVVQSLKTAGDLVSWCQERPLNNLLDAPQAAAQSFCLGLFNGIIASHALFASINRDQSPFCPPPGVTPDQGRKIFLKWMEENPENLHEDAISHAMVALIRAFSCRQEHQ